MSGLELVIGSQNSGKVKEYRELLQGIPVNVVGLADVNLGDLDIEENGTTFTENAIIKAQAYARASQKIVLADDSGLVVDALNGAPGIYSARYGGPGLDNAGRRSKLLGDLKGVADDKRTARFMCVIAVCNPMTGEVITVEGSVEGHIMHEERDLGRGFGYDPLFQPVGYDKTFGEMEEDIKNRISHRGVATAKLLPILKEMSKN